MPNNFFFQCKLLYKRDVAAQKLKVLESELEESLQSQSAVESFVTPTAKTKHHSKRKPTETVTSPAISSTPKRRTESQSSATSSGESTAKKPNMSFISPAIFMSPHKTESSVNEQTHSQVYAMKTDEVQPKFSPKREPKFRTNSQSSETPSVDSVLQIHTKQSGHMNEEATDASVQSDGPDRKSKKKKRRTQNDSDTDLNSSMGLSDVDVKLSKKSKKLKLNELQGENGEDMDDYMAKERMAARRSDLFGEQSLLSSTKIKVEEDRTSVKSPHKKQKKSGKDGEPEKPPR